MPCRTSTETGVQIVDSVHLRQVITNAFDNLVKFKREIAFLQEAMAEKDLLHGKEIKELKEILDATAKIAGAAAAGRKAWYRL